jgi:RNA polymerase sigma factor (sigma-70 family)
VADYAATHAAIEAVWRIESPRLTAALARITGDVDAAEELAQDALVIALEQWPVRGVPDGPGAWLMATAKHRAIDLVRRRARYNQKLQEVGRNMEAQAQALGEPDAEDIADHVGDDLLRLIFIACHPVLSAEARAALTLRLIGGLTTHEIARAFLVSEPAIAQRIVRAKRTLAERKIPFEIPAPGELAGRVGSVLDVIYLIFNEGYAATSGQAWVRPELCAEALRLGRVLAGLMPRNIERAARQPEEMARPAGRKRQDARNPAAAHRQVHGDAASAQASYLIGVTCPLSAAMSLRVWPGYAEKAQPGGWASPGVTIRSNVPKPGQAWPAVCRSR